MAGEPSCSTCDHSHRTPALFSFLLLLLLLLPPPSCCSFLLPAPAPAPPAPAPPAPAPPRLLSFLLLLKFVFVFFFFLKFCSLAKRAFNTATQPFSLTIIPRGCGPLLKGRVAACPQGLPPDALCHDPAANAATLAALLAAHRIRHLHAGVVFLERRKLLRERRPPSQSTTKARAADDELSPAVQMEWFAKRYDQKLAELEDELKQRRAVGGVGGDGAGRQAGGGAAVPEVWCQPSTSLAHSAAPPSTVSRRFNSDGERPRQQNDRSLVRG